MSPKKKGQSKLRNQDPFQDSKSDETHGDDTQKCLPLDRIKQMNSLFFSYDPRGVKPNHKLPESYCPGCRCPRNYCSDIVMKKEIEEHVRFLVNDDRSCRCGHPLTIMALESQVKKAYSHQINHRMLNNGIKYVEGFNPYQGHKIPKCMEGTQDRITKMIMEEEDTIAEKLHNDYIIKKDEYNYPSLKLVPDKDDSETDDDLPDLKDRREKSEREDGEYMCVHQKPDVGPMFKVMKMEMARKNANK